MEIRYDLQNNKETELIKIIDTVTNESLSLIHISEPTRH